MKKLVSILICAVMIVSSGTSLAAAATNSEQAVPLAFISPRASEQLDSYAISLTAKGDGILSVYYSVYGTHDKMACIGAQTITIEKKTGSSTWTTYKTFSSLYSYNTISRVDSFTFNAVPGTTYRAVMTAYGRDSSGSDTGEITSYSVAAT